MESSAACSLTGQRVDIWRPDNGMSGATQPVRAQMIGHDVQKIGTFGHALASSISR